MNSLSKYVDKTPCTMDVLKQLNQPVEEEEEIKVRIIKSNASERASRQRSCSLLILSECLVSYRFSLLLVLLLNRQIRNYFSNIEANRGRE